MLPLSNLTITFSRSRDYKRFTILLHAITLVALFRSGLPVVVKFGLVLILLIAFVYTLCRDYPLCSYHQLSYQQHHWILYQSNGLATRYEQARISFEGGLFLLLALSGEHTNKTLVLFRDQMTGEDYRLLTLKSFIDYRQL